MAVVENCHIRPGLKDIKLVDQVSPVSIMLLYCYEGCRGHGTIRDAPVAGVIRRHARRIGRIGKHPSSELPCPPLSPRVCRLAVMQCSAEPGRRSAATALPPAAWTRLPFLKLAAHRKSRSGQPAFSPAFRRAQCRH